MLPYLKIFIQYSELLVEKSHRGGQTRVKMTKRAKAIIAEHQLTHNCLTNSDMLGATDRADNLNYIFGMN